MNCRDFQREADALLDADSDALPSVLAVETRLIAHAENCPACRPILARYQTLRRAIGAWKNPPTPPADLIDRVLAAPNRRDHESRPFLAVIGWPEHRERVRLIAGFAASVLLLVMVGAVLNRMMHPGTLEPSISAARDPQTVAAPAPALDRALADATSATIALARSASEPAARVGRELLVVVETSDDPSLVPTSLDPIGAGTLGAADVLQRMGDEVAAGVRPLSNSARHAFGFLLGVPRPAGSRPEGSNSNGARNG